MIKKLRLNTITSFLLEIVTVISGFILPRLIMEEYGSSINGLVNSITQFIGIIAFLEFGVGKVVQSALYKPLVDKDNEQISKVVISANKFFKRIAEIMGIYILVLIVIYPFVFGQEFGWTYTAVLIIAMSISSFAQNYCGIVDKLLLNADQKGYIQYTIQIITLILNTIACAIFIRLGFSIQIVKLTTSLIFLLRPIFISWYVRRNYSIDHAISYDKEPLQQKWNGLAQHIAYVVLNNTDTVVLTVLGSFSDVSIYSAYNLVVYGVKQLFTSMMGGVEAYLGNLWAKKEIQTLRSTFDWVEWSIHTLVVFVFGCTGILIVPFIQCYTNGINDANYIQPLFAVLIVLAHACHCLRLPYNLMIFAAGHYKQTQNNYIIASVMNIAISIACVKIWGLVGVAIGTLVSMLYQTIWMAFYNMKHLVIRPLKVFIKQMVVDTILIVIFFFFPVNTQLDNLSYLSWIILAVQVVVIFAVITLLVNLIFYKQYIFALPNLLRRKMKQ